MNWNDFYLVCFGVGLVLSFLSAFLGMGHGHVHFGHGAHVRGIGKVQGAHGGEMPAVNGFTLTAFQCWFGGVGYLLHTFSGFVMLAVLSVATLSGIAGAVAIQMVLVKVLLPREKTLEPQDTEMTGVVGRVSDSIRPDGVGEILFSQIGARRAAAARSEDGTAIERGTEVVVMRYERGIAYVRRWSELSGEMSESG